MNRIDRPLQKFARVVGKISYLLFVVCGVFWYLKRQELGAADPVTTSFLASMFFFVMVGFLLGIMGNTDIPDLRVRRSEDRAVADEDEDEPS